MSKTKELLFDLWQLYYRFAKIGTFTIGGGLAMMPMMQKELVENRKWITEDELLDYYAVGQSTPGIIAVNVSTFVGYKLRGILGGICATLGTVTPSLVIIMLLAGVINSIADYPVIQKALNGINVAVAALLTSVIIKFTKKTVKNVLNAVCMIAAFLLIFVLKVPSFIIILSSLAIGSIITFVNLRKAKKAEALTEEAEGGEGAENDNA